MRFSLNITPVLLVAALIFWSACNTVEDTAPADALDARTTRQLDRSVVNWNSTFGASGITLEGWELGERITARNQEDVVDRVVNPENVWIPTGNIAEPENIEAIRLADASDVDRENAELLLDRIESELIYGRYLATLEWTQDGEPFTTTAILDQDEYVAGLDSIALVGRRNSLADDGLVYDPMLSNIFQIRDDLVVIDSTTGQQARQVSFG